MTSQPIDEVQLKDVCESYCIHPEKVAAAKREMLDGDVAVRMSEIYKMMGDPTRLKMIKVLAVNEMCVCDLAAVLGMEQSAISHQLRLLKNMRIVKMRKDGKSAYYSLDDQHVLTLFNEGLKHVIDH
ncbi:MAG TPA: metalloregulator ArsR/SmtB family transcription factor [Methanocella sp.]|nr:metalloregulator ArsR/SmtB family transcription factor [Methanocella sp.]